MIGNTQKITEAMRLVGAPAPVEVHIRPGAFGRQRFPEKTSAGCVLSDSCRELLYARVCRHSTLRCVTQVAAAKVRRAQEAVLQTRPFSETLQAIFCGTRQRVGYIFKSYTSLIFFCQQRCVCFPTGLSFVERHSRTYDEADAYARAQA